MDPCYELFLYKSVIIISKLIVASDSKIMSNPIKKTHLLPGTCMSKTLTGIISKSLTDYSLVPQAITE